jgi:hypothetical protein
VQVEAVLLEAEVLEITTQTLAALEVQALAVLEGLVLMLRDILTAAAVAVF